MLIRAKAIPLLTLVLWLQLTAYSQTFDAVHLNFTSQQGVTIESVTLNGSEISVRKPLPLFSVVLNDTMLATFTATTIRQDSSFLLNPGISCRITADASAENRTQFQIHFTNISGHNIKLENVVPFGQSKDKTYITGSGSWALARAFLFCPGRMPVSVILPDNAWEMGYASVEVPGGTSLCAIARRTGWEHAERKRYWTIIEPGGSVSYNLYLDVFSGEWQNGLKRMFQKHFLHDLTDFDNALFERKDLQWIRHKYIIALQFAWDHQFYDRNKGVFTLDNFLAEGNRLFGGYDVYGLWPTWPTLGLDERNQFDLFSDLPGGLHGLRREMQKAKNDSTHFFICYNPWDESTRTEDHYAALSELIAATDADGVVLDTRGSSSLKFQQAADNVKPGVIMYSEGMAIPKDMPGIVAGRVHDAIYQQPVLNLNKLIKPDFAIFRVLQLSQGRLHRELALSFFNGYGNEINSFAPGRPDWMEAEFLYMGRLARIQRENSLVFTSQNWTPLIDAAVDSIWVNCWPSLEKTLYTIYSLRPEGFAAPIISIAKKPDVHYVDLLAHEEISVDSSSGKSMLPGCIDAFNKVWLGTRREGNAGCLAVLPRLLHTRLIDDSLFVQAETGSEIRLWVGAPSYQNNPATFSSGSHRIKLSDTFDLTEGKFVVQLFEGDELLDENILTLQPGSPRLISKKGRTKPANRAPQGMVEIPAGAYSFTATQSASFIPYPDFSEPRKMKMKRFFIDKYPVTNGEFRKFIQKTSYAPKDTANFLKHWKLESAWQKIENQPVTYVSLEDAEAYANWTGKRLPTQIEWQYAAQGTTGNNWPWGASFDSTRCNNALGYLTSVDEFPTGENQFGVADLVGNVWQLTSDIYENGSYNFIILKGGSYFKPTSSWWYVEGGPQPLHKQQMLLMLSPGFERNATVGFRCVVDGE